MDWIRTVSACAPFGSINHAGSPGWNIEASLPEASAVPRVRVSGAPAGWVNPAPAVTHEPNRGCGVFEVLIVNVDGIWRYMSGYRPFFFKDLDFDFGTAGDEAIAPPKQ